jgi:hypothetical protein
MSDGTKVKLGVCDVTFNSVSLGYTKGGVNLTLETQVHEITVDQEGPAPIGAIIMGRKCTVEVPLAETDYSRLQDLMPASTYTALTNVLDIESGAGQDLMTYTYTLNLHPHGLEATDYRYDINIWKAAPVANLRFTMTADGEWLYPVQFTGFVPESTHLHSGVIMSFGGVS